ncbi:hypothetical protein PHMEG_00027030, partial [Phytophthora megakarya]
FVPDLHKRTPDNKKVYGKELKVSEVYEPRFRSTNHVDAFLVALPILEIYEQMKDDETDRSVIYTWLEASFQASKITLSMIKRRQKLFQWEIARLDEFLDGHIQEHIAMKADSSCEENVIQEHSKEGFIKELEY